MDLRIAPMLILGMLCTSAGCDNPKPRVHNYMTDEVKEETKIDEGPRLAFNYDARMHFGLTVIKDTAGWPLNKRLTFAPDGKTNSTLIQIDGKSIEFGGHGGVWAKKDEKFPNGSRSSWALSHVMVSQVLKIVLGEQPVVIAPGVRQRILDTCLIRYEIHNIDTQDHWIGVRIVMDTMIGSNDGVPFAAPTMRGLVDSCKEFSPGEVPDFVQALEVADLKNPGTIAHMTLRVPNLESPSRVRLTLWPGYTNPHWNKMWDVPLEPMRQTKHLKFNNQDRQEKLSDSCVVLYWHAQVLKPGEKRNLGFAYGLGRLSGTDSTGKLALTCNGSFEPDGEFTVTAYVKNPQPNQTLSLGLPQGLECIEGQPIELVPPPLAVETGNASDTSVITWKIKAAQAGKHLVTVRSSTGIVQTLEVTVQPK